MAEQTNQVAVIISDFDGISDVYVCNGYDEADAKARDIFSNELEEREMTEEDKCVGANPRHCYSIYDWKVELKDVTPN